MRHLAEVSGWHTQARRESQLRGLRCYVVPTLAVPSSPLVRPLARRPSRRFLDSSAVALHHAQLPRLARPAGCTPPPRRGRRRAGRPAITSHFVSTVRRAPTGCPHRYPLSMRSPGIMPIHILHRLGLEPWSDQRFVFRESEAAVKVRRRGRGSAQGGRERACEMGRSVPPRAKALGRGRAGGALPSDLTCVCSDPLPL